jgi:hypothetical protein
LPLSANPPSATLYGGHPTWFSYADSLIQIRIRAISADTLHYTLYPSAPPYIPPSVRHTSWRTGSLILATTSQNISLILGYKSLSIGLQFGYADKKLSPLIGIHFQF